MASSPAEVDYTDESINIPLQIFAGVSQEMLREKGSPEKLAQRLLQCLHDLENVNFSKFQEVFYDVAENDEVFEQLRIQSNQFASIYPLLVGTNKRNFALTNGLLVVLYRCAQSSVSTNLLAQEKRVWGFLVPLFNVEYGRVRIEGSLRCEGIFFGLISFLIPYANKRTWKFAVKCGILKQLLAWIQKKPRTCNSTRTLHLIALVLSRPITKGSIDTLVRAGLFTYLEQLVQKSGHLLKASPPCSECNTTSNKDINMCSIYFQQVFKKKNNIKSILILSPLLHPLLLFVFFRS